MRSVQYLFFSVIFSAFSSLILQAQEMPPKVISQVVVESNKKFFSEDHAVNSFDLKSIKVNPVKAIGYVLDQYTPVIIRNYGSAGSVSTVSMQGTGSNHTQITWNGIPLNSPTTGQADLSLIPTAFIQSIELVNGASGSLYGSGTFGGSVNLVNEPDWNNRLSAYYSFFTGAYGTRAHLLNLNTGNKLIQYQLSAITSGSENSFSFKDTYRYGSPIVKNSHNAYRDYGLMQNLFVCLNKNSTLEAGIWYQFKKYEVPSLMGSYKASHAIQKDSLFRSFLSFNQSGGKYKLTSKAAWFSDFLNYTDKANETDSVYSLDSRISASHLMAETDLRYFLSSRIVIGSGLSYNRLWGVSNNYGGKIAENEIALYGTIKMILRKVIVNAGLRKEFYKQLNPVPQYSMGIRYNLNNRLIMRSSFSSKFRKPTFNEKYWQPGGNPQLRPENGRGGDISIEWNASEANDHAIAFNAKISGYYQTIDNWIQWVMEDYLKPVEYKKVNAKGIETWLDIRYHTGLWMMKGRLNYNLNKSVIVNTYHHEADKKGNQLIYIPVHSAKLYADVIYRNMSMGMSAQYTGIRETDESNNALYRLPGYALLNVSTAWQKKIDRMFVSFCFSIDNVFDTPYEVMRSFAVPGRTWLISLSVGWNNNKNEK